MITKKEDLIGRYALRSEKEVFELFMQKCEEFGLFWVTGHKPRNLPSGQAVDYNSDRDGLTQDDEAFFEKKGYKKLTLSDLKPRTRTEYEKVTFNEDYEHLCRMIKGESFYDCRGEIEYKFNGYGFVCAQGFGEYQNAKWDSSRPSELYQKVEKEIDWTNDVMNFLRRELHDGGCVRNASIEGLGGNFGCVNIDISFRHERFLELCRVALRANGEIE